MSFPSPAKDYHEEKIDLNNLLIANPSATFPMRVETDAMNGDGIISGSLALVDRSLPVRNGNIIVAIVGGELLMRRFEDGINGKSLVATNKKYRPIKVDGELYVWGVVSVIISNPNSVGYVCFSGL